MFDIGFTELLVIAVVALVVLGPERLPKAARFAGLWVRRARAQWDSVKGELERELAAEDLKRNLRQAQDAVREAGQAVRESGEKVQRELAQVQAEVDGHVAQSASGEPAAEASPVDDPTEPPGEPPGPEAPTEQDEAEEAAGPGPQAELFPAPPKREAP